MHSTIHRVMRSRHLLAGLVILLTVGGCGEGFAPAVQSDGSSPKERIAALEGDTDAVNAVIHAFNQAFDARDVNRIASLFTDNAEVYMADGTVVAAQRLGIKMAPVWSGWSDLNTNWELKAVKLARPYGWAKYTETFSYLDRGHPHVMHNLVTMTFELRERHWLITHLHLSTASRADGR
ncbi:MAG: nuclear transport factor 2 family protein [Acidobacteriota bacterium]